MAGDEDDRGMGPRAASGEAGPEPAGDEPEYRFGAELWEWSEAGGDAATWVFLTLPPEVDADIRDRPRPPRGFGSVRVEVTVGSTTWRTSVFPDKVRGFVLPVKKPVRRAERLDVGDRAEVRLRLLD